MTKPLADTCDIFTSEIIKYQLYQKAYGPRFCNKCNKICEVILYVLKDSEKLKIKENKVILEFMGSIVCKECMNIIEVTND